jgi:hypothetical protein
LQLAGQLAVRLPVRFAVARIARAGVGNDPWQWIFRAHGLVSLLLLAGHFHDSAEAGASISAAIMVDMVFLNHFIGKFRP